MVYFPSLVCTLTRSVVAPQIILPFNPANENFSPSALQGSQDIISVNIFDEVSCGSGIISSNHSPRYKQRIENDDTEAGSTYPKRDRYFLGCLKLPLSTVFQVGRLEGTFDLETPPVLLGYQHDKNGRRSLLRVFATLQPELQRPVCKVDGMRHGESDDLARHASRWVMQGIEVLTISFTVSGFISNFRNRKFYWENSENCLKDTSFHSLLKFIIQVDSTGYCPSTLCEAPCVLHGHGH